ncbi:MAG: fucose isomerase [Lachnospiraceae bacterium]|nr:fucose isomerase [Lachnospiraceae bacterium]
MLKGIPGIIGPELLKTLCEMGHGDCIVFADNNFPAESVGKNSKVIRMDGHGIPEILDAVLSLIPLDQYEEKPVTLMERCEGDNVDVSIWNTYEELLVKYEERGAALVQKLERFEFYEQAKKAYAVVATGETGRYANIILQKGCIIGND